MSDILIGVIVFGLVFGAAIFGMFLGRNLRVLEQKLTRATLLRRGYSVLSKLSEADVRRRIFMELIYLSLFDRRQPFVHADAPVAKLK